MLRIVALHTIAKLCLAIGARLGGYRMSFAHPIRPYPYNPSFRGVFGPELWCITPICLWQMHLLPSQTNPYRKSCHAAGYAYAAFGSLSCKDG